MTTIRMRSARELAVLQDARDFRDSIVSAFPDLRPYQINYIVGQAAIFGESCAPAGGVVRAVCREITTDPRVIA